MRCGLKQTDFYGQLDIEIRILPRIINDAQRSSGTAGERYPRRYHHYQHPVQQHRRHGKADWIRLLNGCGTRQLATISSPVVVFQKFSAAHTHARTQRPTNRPNTYFLRRPVEWTAEAVSFCSALGDVPPEINPFYGNGSAVRFRT